MFHLALFDASIANGSTMLQVASLADPIIAPSGSGFLVPATINKLMRVAAEGVNLTRVQLTSASIRDYAPFDIGPVNVGAPIGTPARLVRWDDNPLELDVNEELDAFGVQSNAGAQRITVAAWFCDGPVRKLTQRAFSVHWTATATMVANAFTAFTPVLDNGIPSGTFILAGSRLISATALFHRFVPRGGPAYRPGGFAVQAQSDYPEDGSRYGEMGEWLRFTNTTLPQIEAFCRSADTTLEGYLDLIQIA